MTTPDRSDASAFAVRWQLPNTAALLVTLATVVLVRSILVSLYGVELPFLDQWDAEIANLYLPLVEGRLGLADLFASHNEHRILFTRLFGLLLFEANERQFDNLVTALANTAIYAMMLGAFAAPFFRELKRHNLILAGMALALFGTLPYGWENLTIGFQNQFYFAALWAFVAIGTLAFARNGSWLAVVAAAASALCGLFTMASGAFAAPVLIGVAFALYRNGALSGRQLAFVAVSSGAIFALGLQLIPPGMRNSGLHAQSLQELASVARIALCWPLPASWIILLLIWWPSALWAWRVLRSAPAIPRADLFLLGVAAWGALHAVAIAISRGHGTVDIASRHAETLVFGAAANLLLAIRIVQSLYGIERSRKRAAMLGLFVAMTTGAFLLGLADRSFTGMNYLAAKAANQRIAERNISDFLSQANASTLLGKPGQEISYPDPQRLISLLSNPAVRQMMPASVAPAVAVEWSDCALLASPGAYPTTPPLRTAAFGTHGVYGDGNVGRCSSSVLHASRSHVRLPTAGYLDRAGLQLVLKASSGDDAVASRYKRPDREQWHSWNPAVPAPNYVLVVTDDNPQSWFAFGAPVDQGRLSALAADTAQQLRHLVDAY